MITTLVKLTRSQLTILQNGGTVGSHTYDPDHCLYMVDDGLELPTESGRYVLTTDDDGESFQYEVLNLTWNEISGKPSTFPPSAHTHSAADITTGTIALARLPVGTAATQVAAGNHTHSAYVNQNAFGNIKVGSTTTAASSTTDTITFAAGGDLGVSISGKTVTYSITLPTQLPASDVYQWAKAANKPSYTHTEIGAGNVVIGDGANYIEYRTGDTWKAGIYYHTVNDESAVFANQNARASWIFAYTNPEDRVSWRTLTPSLQIKNGKVAINKLIDTGTQGAYNLDVNGTLNATTIYQNGTALSTVATSGSYNDLSNKPTIPSVTVSNGVIIFA